MNPIAINSTLKTAETEVSRLLTDLLNSESADFLKYKNKIFSVGGFVRDEYLNILSNDLDLAIEIQNGAELFSKHLHSLFITQTTSPFQKGLGYPIWYIKFNDDILFENSIYHTKNGSVDFADTQKECFPDPRTRQRITTYGTLTEDIQRRDFTINMLAKNLTTNEVIDLSTQGFNDLNTKQIQTHPLSNANQVFSDDPLRMIRAIRFAVKYNFTISETVEKSMTQNSHRLQIVSSERIWGELKKMIESGTFFHALQRLQDLHLFSKIFKHMTISKSQLQILLTLPKNTDCIFNWLRFLTFSTIENSQKTLNELKVEVAIVKKTIKALNGQALLIQDASSWSILQFRQFIRIYSDVLYILVQIFPEYADHFLSAQTVPVQVTPHLNGDDIIRLFNVKGAKIKDILNLALQYEDELIVKTNCPLTESDKIFILERLKENFKC